jgi:hypothetical protein
MYLILNVNIFNVLICEVYRKKPDVLVAVAAELAPGQALAQPLAVAVAAERRATDWASHRQQWPGPRSRRRCSLAVGPTAAHKKLHRVPTVGSEMK